MNALIIGIFYMMKVHYIRNAVAEQDRKMEAFKKKLEEMQAMPRAEGQERLAKMESYRHES